MNVHYPYDDDALFHGEGDDGGYDGVQTHDGCDGGRNRGDDGIRGRGDGARGANGGDGHGGGDDVHGGSGESDGGGHGVHASDGCDDCGGYGGDDNFPACWLRLD